MNPPLSIAEKRVSDAHRNRTFLEHRLPRPDDSTSPSRIYGEDLVPPSPRRPLAISQVDGVWTLQPGWFEWLAFEGTGPITQALPGGRIVAWLEWGVSVISIPGGSGYVHFLSGDYVITGAKILYLAAGVPLPADEQSNPDSSSPGSGYYRRTRTRVIGHFDSNGVPIPSEGGGQYRLGQTLTP